MMVSYGVVTCLAAIHTAALLARRAVLRRQQEGSCPCRHASGRRAFSQREQRHTRATVETAFSRELRCVLLIGT